MFYMVVSFSKIIEFISVIQRVYLKDAYHHWIVASKIISLDEQQRNRLLAHDSKVILEADFSPEIMQVADHILRTMRSAKDPYVKQKRKYGEGERRLG